MAAESRLLRDRAETEFFALEAGSALNRESSGRMPFAWTLNPYRGCEFGCHYCYARYTREFMEMWSSSDFERKIYAKTNAPDLLRAELAAAEDAQLHAPWSLAKGSHVIFTMPRIAVLRGMIFNHAVHHRAQLGVSLRLNDVLVPVLYGPSADEA